MTTVNSNASQKTAGYTLLKDLAKESISMDNPIWSWIFKKSDSGAIQKTLEAVPAFEGLSAQELVTVERNIHLRNYRAGEVIFNEETPGAAMYIIHTGEVAITKQGEGAESIELARIGELTFFGEIALIDEMPRTAGAVAVKDTELLAFGKPDLEIIVDRNPVLALKIVTNISRLLAKRLVKSNDNFQSIEEELMKLRDEQADE